MFFGRGSPSIYNYSLVAGQSSHIADLPPLHVKRCPKQYLRDAIPVSKELIFVHRSGYYCLWAAVNRYEIIPGADLTVFVQDRGYPAFPLRHSAQLKVNRGFLLSLEFEVHPRTLGPIYPTPLPPRLGQKKYEQSQDCSHLRTTPVTKPKRVNSIGNFFEFNKFVKQLVMYQKCFLLFESGCLSHYW